MKTQTFNNILLSTLLADAHCMSLHWIYNNDDINKLLQDNKINLDVLNNGDWSAYFQGKDAGAQTHHGDQIIHLYNYLKSNNTFTIDAYMQEWKTYIKSYKWYIDKSSKTSIEQLAFNIQPTGADSTDFCALGMSIPLINLALEDKEKALEFALQRTMMTHNNTLTLDSTRWFIRALFRIAEGNGIMRGMDLAAETIKNEVFQEIFQLGKSLSYRENKESISKLIQEVGLGCDIRVGLPITVVLIERYQSNYMQFLIENTKAGADASSRAMVGGALIGAMSNTVLPEKLIKQMSFKL